MSDPISTAFKAAKAKHPTLTLEMAKAVIHAYEAAHEQVFLTQDEKYDISSRITLRQGSVKDAVQDVFEEIATMFVVRRRG